MFMRILLLTISLIASLPFAHAQIRRGSVLLGGYMNVEGRSKVGVFMEPSRDAGLYLNLKGGYFLVENLALGIDYRQRPYTGGGVKAFGRYYYEGKVIAGIGYDITENAPTAEGGYAFFAAPFVAIEPTIFYRAFGKISTRQVGLNVNVSFFLNRRVKKD